MRVQKSSGLQQHSSSRTPSYKTLVHCRYFLSGSLDGKLRLWNIPDKKVHLWNELEGTHTKLITCANFCQNGKFAVVGSYDGRCVFYTTDQLKYYTQIAVRSSRGKNSAGKKISGIEPMPGEDKILVTSNDSRIRLYDLRDLSLSCKYRWAIFPLRVFPHSLVFSYFPHVPAFSS